MTQISTHILDLVHGKPAAGVPVRFDVQAAPDHWRNLASEQTDGDGRCARLFAGDLTPGVYRLVFETGVYFGAQQTASLYPFIEVAFHVRAGETHFHIPLLLNPHGYTTYRGT